MYYTYCGDMSMWTWSVVLLLIIYVFGISEHGHNLLEDIYFVCVCVRRVFFP